MWSYGVET